MNPEANTQDKADTVSTRASSQRSLPRGSWDCHFHVFPSTAGFPFAAERSYTPAPAPFEAYDALATSLGIEHSVLVQPSVYGRDHACFEALLRAQPGRLRGVAVAFEDTPPSTLARWHALGTRGTRLNLLHAGGASLRQASRIASMAGEFGWHLQALIDVSATPMLAPDMADLGRPLVLDHFGHFPVGRGVDDPGFRNLLGLLKEERAWLKLSAAYRITPAADRYAAIRPLVDCLVETAPDRLVWGSNWPHPDFDEYRVDDQLLAHLLIEWMDGAALQKVMVDNPRRLYGPH